MFILIIRIFFMERLVWWQYQVQSNAIGYRLLKKFKNANELLLTIAVSGNGIEVEENRVNTIDIADISNSQQVILNDLKSLSQSYHVIKKLLQQKVN